MFKWLEATKLQIACSCTFVSLLYLCITGLFMMLDTLQIPPLQANQWYILCKINFQKCKDHQNVAIFIYVIFLHCATMKDDALLTSLPGASVCQVEQLMFRHNHRSSQVWQCCWKWTMPHVWVMVTSLAVSLMNSVEYYRDVWSTGGVYYVRLVIKYK